MIKTKDHSSEKVYCEISRINTKLSIGEKSYHYSYHLDDFFYETFIAAALWPTTASFPSHSPLHASGVSLRHAFSDACWDYSTDWNDDRTDDTQMDVRRCARGGCEGFRIVQKNFNAFFIYQLTACSDYSSDWMLFHRLDMNMAFRLCGFSVRWKVSLISRFHHMIFCNLRYESSNCCSEWTFCRKTSTRMVYRRCELA